MDKMKQYVVFTVLGSVLILAAGWFLLVSPKRSEAADLQGQTAMQISANLQLQNKLAMLKSQAKSLPKQQAKLAAVAAKIPDNPALPALVRALTKASASAGIELLSVTPGAPTAVAAAAAPAAPVAGSKAAASTSTSTASAATGSLSNIPLTLTLAGGYFQVEQFLNNLENLSRAMRVTSVTMAPGANPLKVAPTGTTAVAPLSDRRTQTSTVAGFV
jgi:type IV pilus assembly protein PilO